MKRIIWEISIYSLFVFIPTFLNLIIFKVSLITLWVPIYLIVISIYSDRRYKDKFNLWRISPCACVLFVGYIFDTQYIEYYYPSILHSTVDSFTYLISKYLYAGEFIVVLVALIVYQCITLVSSHKNNHT